MNTPEEGPYKFRRYYDIRKANRLCVYCRQPNDTDGVRCRACCKKHNARCAHRRAVAVAAGLCRACKAVPSVDGTQYCEVCRDKARECKRRNGHKAKLAAYEAYGGMRCACCGETEEMFLTLDHINNDGWKHRKQGITGDALYKWLRRNDYPEGFQVLCHNCNTGRYRNGGICPHKQHEGNSTNEELSACA